MTNPENALAWIPCPDCDDHWCNIHGMRTHECDCPETEESEPEKWDCRECTAIYGKRNEPWMEWCPNCLAPRKGILPQNANSPDAGAKE
jgi:hypothetical protein